jgi:hypothetical protein
MSLYPIHIRDTILNFSLKKLLTRTDHISVERYQLFSKVHSDLLIKQFRQKWGKVMDADFKVRDEK